MKIGSISNLGRKDIEFKIIKKLKDNLYKVKVIKGDKWYPKNKIYICEDESILIEYFKE